ncbi:hypothetical protein ACFT0E_32585, partial [Streptomyces sp. NPDC057052]
MPLPRVLVVPVVHVAERAGQHPVGRPLRVTPVTPSPVREPVTYTVSPFRKVPVPVPEPPPARTRVPSSTVHVQEVPSSLLTVIRPPSVFPTVPRCHTRTTHSPESPSSTVASPCTASPP